MGEIGAIITSILQIRKLRNREVMWAFQDHTASESQSRDPPRSPELHSSEVCGHRPLFFPPRISLCVYKQLTQGPERS